MSIQALILNDDITSEHEQLQSSHRSFVMLFQSSFPVIITDRPWCSRLHQHNTDALKKNREGIEQWKMQGNLWRRDEEMKEIGPRQVPEQCVNLLSSSFGITVYTIAMLNTWSWETVVKFNQVTKSDHEHPRPHPNMVHCVPTTGHPGVVYFLLISWSLSKDHACPPSCLQCLSIFSFIYTCVPSLPTG